MSSAHRVGGTPFGISLSEAKCRATCADQRDRPLRLSGRALGKRPCAHKSKLQRKKPETAEAFWPDFHANNQTPTRMLANLRNNASDDTRFVHNIDLAKRSSGDPMATWHSSNGILPVPTSRERIFAGDTARVLA